MRRAALTCAAAIAMALSVAAPADAYTLEFVSVTKSPPWMLFQKNYGAPLHSQLIAYVSYGPGEYRITMRAGSGDGTTDECIKNRGWLPTGVYSNTDSDPDSRVKFYNKTWGDPVVTGWVWELGNKWCANSRAYRTGLFIHSQGTSGWSDRNYASAGCVKINQEDRGFFTGMYRYGYQTDRAVMLVY